MKQEELLFQISVSADALAEDAAKNRIALGRWASTIWEEEKESWEI